MARTWSQIYYDIIRSEECVPLGWSVNANLAMVSAFSMHEDRAEAIRRGQDNFEFLQWLKGYPSGSTDFLVADKKNRMGQRARRA